MIESEEGALLTKIDGWANSKVWYLRTDAAEHPLCPITLLEKLATDEDYHVRTSVARNPSCPEYIRTYCIARNFIGGFYEQT